MPHRKKTQLLHRWNNYRKNWLGSRYLAFTLAVTLNEINEIYQGNNPRRMDFASYENVSRYLLTLFMMDVKNSFDLLEMFQDNIFFYKLSPWMTTCESFFMTTFPNLFLINFDHFSSCKLSILGTWCSWDIIIRDTYMVLWYTIIKKIWTITTKLAWLSTGFNERQKPYRMAI